MNKRVFISTSKRIGNTSILTNIDKWVWTKGRGLQVVWKNGERWKSDYKNIKELFAGERVTEIKS